MNLGAPKNRPFTGRHFFGFDIIFSVLTSLTKIYMYVLPLAFFDLRSFSVWKAIIFGQIKTFLHFFGLFFFFQAVPRQSGKIFFFPCKKRPCYSWFHIKGTWSVYSFNGDYLLSLSAQVGVSTFLWNPQFVLEKVKNFQGRSVGRLFEISRF